MKEDTINKKKLQEEKGKENDMKNSFLVGRTPKAGVCAGKESRLLQAGRNENRSSTSVINQVFPKGWL